MSMIRNGSMHWTRYNKYHVGCLWESANDTIINMENLRPEIKGGKDLESRDQEVANRLSSLGIKFESSVNSDGELVYTFHNVKEIDNNSAFLLDAGSKKIIYQSLHFGHEKFSEPGSNKEVSPQELLQYLSEKFPEADNFIFSCCSPDKARALLTDVDDKLIFIGTGIGNYSTWHYDKENKLSSVKNIKNK